MIPSPVSDIVRILFLTGVVLCFPGPSPAQDAPAPAASGPPLPKAGAFTVTELLTKAQEAFQSGNFPEAEAYFLAFERDFGEEEETADIVARNKPLIALCMISNGRSTAARPYIEAALAQPKLPRDIRQELAFWMAIFLMQDEDYRTAQDGFGKFFKGQNFDYSKRMEAMMLFGYCYLAQGYHRTAAEFYENQIAWLRQKGIGAEYAGRCVVLQMMALIKTGQNEKALALLKEEYARMGDITQLVSFQTFALQLGSQFMEEKRFHEAIACLQRIWRKDRLLQHQEAKLADIRKMRDTFARIPNRQSAVFQLDGQIRQVEREIENFKQLEDFDAALRFRLAMAFQGLERFREAALILEDMMVNMPPSPIVQSASMAVIQSWMQLERWPKALEAAENYLIAYGDDRDNPQLPQVLFMQADALQKVGRLAEANSIYESIVNLFPESPLVAKALFMQGFTNLLLDANDSAIRSFDQLMKDHPDSTMVQDADYWKGMAYSFMQEYVTCRDHMAAYLERYQADGARYEPEAVFRMAYATFCEADYPASIAEFRDFLETYGDTAADADEARLLLGDALLGEGEADEGIAAYKSINPESTRFFEDGWFKVGKAYKLLEDIPAMRAHYEDFLEKYPESQRMPEAVYWIGFTHVKDEDLDKAKAIYWETLRQHGDNPELFAIEEVFTGLQKVYRKEGVEGLRQLQRDLQALHREALDEERKTLALRTLWAESNVVRPKNAPLADGLLSRAGRWVDAEIHNPQIVADAADAARRAGNPQTAEKLYTELKRWNPNSFHLHRAYAGLGHLAAEAGDNIEAIQWFEEFEKEAAGSVEVPEILLAKARLQAGENKPQSAQTTFNEILEHPAASSLHKARALIGLGDLLVRQKSDEKATAYYERVYVAYGRDRELVAQAYFKRGQALERLDLKTEAWQVYSELAGRDDLLEFAEAGQARKRAEALEAFAPEPEDPAGAESQPGEGSS